MKRITYILIFVFTIALTARAGGNDTYVQWESLDDNSVFLTHEHIWVQPGSYSNWGTKEIHLTGFAIDGTQTISDIVLMQKIDCVTPYCHFAEPDCAGGGYAYISVAGDTTGNSFKVFSVLII